MTKLHEESLRVRIIAVADSWLGTPYHPMGRVKGVGVDCLTLLAEVYAEAGLIAPLEVPYYPHDWHLHRAAERYLEGLSRYTHEVQLPLAGDIVPFRFGRCFSHGAIVIEWPRIIHAYVGRACMIENVQTATWLMRRGEQGSQADYLRERRFFSLFAPA